MLTFFAAAKKVSPAPDRGNACAPARNRVAAKTPSNRKEESARACVSFARACKPRRRADDHPRRQRDFFRVEGERTLAHTYRHISSPRYPRASGSLIRNCAAKALTGLSQLTSLSTLYIEPLVQPRKAPPFYPRCIHPQPRTERPSEPLTDIRGKALGGSSPDPLCRRKPAWVGAFRPVYNLVFRLSGINAIGSVPTYSKNPHKLI